MTRSARIDGGDDDDGDDDYDDDDVDGVQTNWGAQLTLSYCARTHCGLRLQLGVQCRILLVQCVSGQVGGLSPGLG